MLRIAAVMDSLLVVRRSLPPRASVRSFSFLLPALPEVVRPADLSANDGTASPRTFCDARAENHHHLPFSRRVN